MKKERIPNSKVYFVSSNKRDFCENDDTRDFHKDLKGYAKEAKILYKPNIASFINELPKTTKISKDIVESIEKDSYIGSVFEVYKDRVGEYRFRLKARNGLILLTSYGYSDKKECYNSIYRIKSELS